MRMPREMAKLGEKKYDIVVANIVADVIIAVSPAAAKLVADDGVYITSGIIEDRIDDVKTALEECGFLIKALNRRADWASIICKKK